MVEYPADELDCFSRFFNIGVVPYKASCPRGKVPIGRKLFGKANKQSAPIHLLVVHRPVKGVVIDLFEKILAGFLHPA